MKNILFRKILLSSIVISCILFIALEMYLSRVVRNSYIAQLEKNLSIQARLVLDMIPQPIGPGLGAFCRTYREKTGARITVIDGTGRVLGDSDGPSEKMENHAERPEIEQAAVSGTGTSIRLSDTLHREFFYLAMSMGENGRKGFLRLAVPLHDMHAAVSGVRMRIAAASLIALFSAVLIGLFHAANAARAIGEIARFSADIRSGNFRTRLSINEKGEIGELARNVNDMAQELRIRLHDCQKEHYKVQEILNNMSDGLLLTDIEGRIFFCNPAIKRIFSVETDIEGRTLMETTRNAELMDVITEAVKKGRTASKEVEVMYPEEIHVIATAVPFRYPPGNETVTGVVLSVHDITRLKKLEEARKDFVANVSHEIKTPVTAIKGFAETLLGGAIDDRENALKFLQTIQYHGERLDALVDDLLTLSRIELGEIKIKKTDVDLNEIIDTVCTTLKNKAGTKGIQFAKEVPADLQIRADRNRLVQILLNLLDNGIKFTEKGEVKIGAGRTMRDEGGGTGARRTGLVEISISDTGIGIPRTYLPRLGERFFRGDPSRSRELGGTGLGLAIVKHLVKAHGWQMKIESEEGRGTRVSVFVT